MCKKVLSIVDYFLLGLTILVLLLPLLGLLYGAMFDQTKYGQSVHLEPSLEDYSNCVAVGHKGDYGRAKVYHCEIPFNKETKVKPPFPSAPTYDAKAWEFMKRYASPGALFWNVGS